MARTTMQPRSTSRHPTAQSPRPAAREPTTSTSPRSAAHKRVSQKRWRRALGVTDRCENWARMSSRAFDPHYPRDAPRSTSLAACTASRACTRAARRSTTAAATGTRDRDARPAAPRRARRRRARGRLRAPCRARAGAPRWLARGWCAPRPRVHGRSGPTSLCTVTAPLVRVGTPTTRRARRSCWRSSSSRGPRAACASARVVSGTRARRRRHQECREARERSRTATRSSNCGSRRETRTRWTAPSSTATSTAHQHPRSATRVGAWSSSSGGRHRRGAS